MRRIKAQQKVRARQLASAEVKVIKATNAADNAVIKAKKATENLEKLMKQTLATRRSDRARKPSQAGVQYRTEQSRKKRKVEQTKRNKKSRAEVNKIMDKELLAMIRKMGV